MPDSGPDIDAEEFDAFYEHARERLVLQVAALGPGPAEARNHVQEAFVRAWMRWSYVSGLDDPESWVRRVARNRALGRWRRARRALTGRSPDTVVEPPAGSVRVLTRRTTVPSAWQAADTVRRTAVRRRRIKWGAGAAVVLAAAVTAATSLDRSTSPDPGVHLAGSVHSVPGPDGSVQLVADTGPITDPDPAAVDAVVAAEQRLSLALLSQVGDGSNVTVSPASLYLALGMLQNGARGLTVDEISKALQADGLSTEKQNSGLAALTHDLATVAAKDGIELDSANSLWQQRGFAVKPAFLRALAAYYDAGVWQVDYKRHLADALAALNAWTSDKTHGKITKLFDSLDPSTVLVLANAIYFHADWRTPFNPAGTSPGLFTTPTGQQVNVKFMSGEAGLRGAITNDYQAVELPYTGGRFAALAIMPTRGTLTDYVATLTPEDITRVADGLDTNALVAMPRFTTTSTIDLKPVLQALGMRAAFTGDADFSGLSAEATMVDQVVQRDYLGVGERGTTAAAVTGVSMVPTAAPFGPQIRLDHPFLFLIRDTKTGAILFASEITDPSAV